MKITVPFLTALVILFAARMLKVLTIHEAYPGHYVHSSGMPIDIPHWAMPLRLAVSPSSSSR